MSLPRIGQLLVDAQVIRQEQLEEALRIKANDGRKLGQILVDTGMASETLLTQTLSRQLSIPWVSLHHLQFSRTLLSLVSRETAQKQGVLPLFVQRAAGEEPILYVAIDDPTNEAVLGALAAEVRMAVRPMIASPNDLRRAIDTFYGQAAQADAATIPPSDRILGSEAFDVSVPAGDSGVWAGPTTPSARPPAPPSPIDSFGIGPQSPLGGIARAIAVSLPNGEARSMLAPSTPSPEWELFVRDLLTSLERDGVITGFTFPDH
jgi:type IV pilus assembly protein PilB